MSVAIIATQKADLDRALAALHQPAQDVEAVVVRAEQMAAEGRVVAVDYVGVDLVGVVKKRPDEAEQHHEDHDDHTDDRKLVLGKRAEHKLRDAALLVDLSPLDFG